MLLTAPHETPVARAARGMAGAARPLGLGAWREISRTGTLRDDPDPDGTAAGLVRRWHQHLAVAIDLPMERLPAGDERLPELLGAWLDLSRRTEAVRSRIRTAGGPRTAAESDRQRALLATLLAEDLALLGVPEPRRSALDLLTELAAVAAAEDAAGRALPRLRRTLLGTPSTEERRPRLVEHLTGWWRGRSAG